MLLNRHLKSFVAAALAFVCGAATAQPAGNYPDKPIRIIIPYSAGGPTDLIARLIAQHLTTAWGQPVVPENRVGANGTIGQDAVAKAEPDGYTVLMQSVAFAINPSLYKLPYDSDKDFAPVSQVSSTYLLLVVHPDVPAKTVKELIALAKAKPGQLNYASFGAGSIAHLAGESFKVATGVNMAHIPYKGATPALTDVISGRVQVMFPSIGSAVQFAEAGKLRGLAVTSRTRSPLAPQLPTMIEAGVPDFESATWNGLFFPAGTPKPIVSRLHAEVVRMIGTPETQAKLRALGVEPVSSASPEAFQTFLRAERKKYADAAKAAGLRTE
jgi:tripartite-type tricarboxylate transporter receptor subunit TctC